MISDWSLQNFEHKHLVLPATFPVFLQFKEDTSLTKQEISPFKSWCPDSAFTIELAANYADADKNMPTQQVLENPSDHWN